MKRLWRFLLGLFIILIPINIVCAADWLIKEDGSSYQHRVKVFVKLRGSDVIVDDFPIVAQINFKDVLAESGVNASAVTDSITVVNCTNNQVVPSLFIPDGEMANAGKVCWRADGSFCSIEDIDYYIYFDANKNIENEEGKSKSLNPKERFNRLMDYLFSEDPEDLTDDTDKLDVESSGEIPPFGLYFEAEEFTNRKILVPNNTTIPDASQKEGSEFSYLYAGPGGSAQTLAWCKLDFNSNSIQLPSGKYYFFIRFISDEGEKHIISFKPEIGSNSFGKELQKTVTGNKAPNWKWESIEGIELRRGRYGFYWSMTNFEKRGCVDFIILTNYGFNPPDNFYGFNISLERMETREP